jgi:urate oxidase
MTTKDRLFQEYLEAKAEFERVAHSGTINSDEYEAARERAKLALKKYRDAQAARNLNRSGTTATGAVESP